MSNTKVPAVSAESIAWGALLFAVFMTPLAMTDFGWIGIERPLTASVYTEAKVFVLRVSTLVALAAWAWAVLVDGRPLRRTLLDPWVLAFVGWMAVAAVFSIQPATSVFGHYTRSGGLLTYVLYGTLFFLAVQFADKGSRIARVAQAVFWSGLIVSTYAVLQYLGVDWVGDTPAFLAGRAYSTFGNPVILGSHLVFVLPLSVSLALTEHRPTWRAVYWSGTALGLAALLATFTRSAWIGAAVALVLLAAYAVFHRTKVEPRVDLPAAAVAVVLLVLGIVRSVSGGGRVTNVLARLGDLLQFETGSGFSRLGLWSAALDGVRDRPLTGFGPDTFRLFSPAYLDPEFARAGDYLKIPDNAHNYFLQLASTGGVVALALFVAVLGITAWVSARTTLTVPRGSARGTHLMLASFWAASAGYAINLFANVSMPHTTFMLWISIALLLSPSAKAKPFKPVASGRPLALFVAGICAVAVLASAVPLYADNRYFAATGLTDPPARAAAADAAVRFAPYYDTYRTTRAIAYADPVMGRLRMAGPLEGPAEVQMRSAYEAALGELLDARDFSPWEQNNQVVLVVMYNVGGRHLDTAYHDEAIRVAEEALERLPYAPSLRFHYAIALEGAGRTADARRELEYLVGLEPRMGEAAVQLARIYAADGEGDRALDLLRGAQATAVNQTLVGGALEALERGEPVPPVPW